MFYYKRKISFIEYYINGIKSRCVGIVKQKVAEDVLWIWIELSGLEEWKNFNCKLSIGNAEERQQISVIQIEQGKGQKEIQIALKDIKAECSEKIFFSFGNDCYGIADLCELPKEDIGSEQVIAEEVNGEANGETKEVWTVTDENKSEYDYENDEDEMLDDCLTLQPDKWEVIKKKYPILYPFRGQGPYVSIKPVDLQLLDEKFHKLSDNSFLMHAFYQYRHMILGEYEQDGNTHFYVGVPGEFVKKEQNSAAMFGFEGYEHSGDLGYYLYRVEL